jgi:hypothetical protein
VAVKKAIRLDHHTPALTNRLNLLALGLYYSGQYEAVVEAAKRAIRSNPSFALPYRWLLPHSASLVAPRKQRKCWQRLLRWRRPLSTCLSAGACPGIGPKTTPTCSKACGRPDGARSELAHLIGGPTDHNSMTRPWRRSSRAGASVAPPEEPGEKRALRVLRSSPRSPLCWRLSSSESRFGPSSEATFGGR